MKTQYVHTHVCTHSPQRQHSCADTVEIRASLYFLYLTGNSRVTPTVLFICFHNTHKMWSEQTEDLLQLCSSSFRFLRFNKAAVKLSDYSFSAVSRDNNGLLTRINPDPTLLWSNVLNSVTRTLVLFSLLERYMCVYIFSFPNTQTRWSSPCARFVEPEANWCARGIGL